MDVKTIQEELYARRAGFDEAIANARNEREQINERIRKLIAERDAVPRLVLKRVRKAKVTT